ncbi:toprim domain-containing protein [Spirosoma daeguense]
MNIDQAKQIPIAEILAQLNIHPRKSNGDKQLYLSPIRKEKTPSFWSYLRTNRWYDYGIGQGGDPVDLVCAYLKYHKEDYTVTDALRWLSHIIGGHYKFAPFPVEPYIEANDSSLALKSAKIIQHKALINYLHKRGIPLALANHHLKEIHVRNKRTHKSFFALGLSNEEGGYELRNPFFKGTLGTKAISFIRGRELKPDSIHIFEGFMDYLSAITQLAGKGFKGDTIILNSLSCLKQIQPYIQGYGYRTAYTWLDNDTAGKDGTQALFDFLRTQADLTHKCMNRIYFPHKDVNAWHMHTLNLTL